MTTALASLRSLFAEAGLDRERFGQPDWNPLSALIPEGARVVLKPNWVRHFNGSGGGLECLVTHATVIEAVLQYVSLTRPARVVVGDAPVQGCDFERLLVDSGTGAVLRRFEGAGMPLAVRDFRRTILREDRPGARPLENMRPMEDFVLFDLGEASLLEDITGPDTEFRVTMYDPDVMKRTHGSGRHQYLVARDAVEADVVINLPKLKTHKKAGLTGALKNVVGINGHKEFLPHHRKGGSARGGDCYPGRSPLKGLVEDLLDAANRTRHTLGRRALARAAIAGMGVGKVFGADDNYEGSWHGNDTVWRMTLDLQRILHYGREDGRLSDRIERTIVTITDAIVAGEGEGPLSPTPVEFGMLTLGTCTAAVDWVHALLMGLDPARVPLTRAAFDQGPRPLAGFPPAEVVAQVEGTPVALPSLYAHHGRLFRPPRGWRTPGVLAPAAWAAVAKSA